MPIGATRRYRPARTRPARSDTPLVRITANLPAIPARSGEGQLAWRRTSWAPGADLFETGFEWDEAGLGDLADRLGALGPSPVAELADGFAACGCGSAMGEMPEPLRREVEAVIYPRLWKVLEAVRDGLPEGEQRVRVQVLNRRLARLLAAESKPAI